MPEYKFIPKEESIVPKYAREPRGFFWLFFVIFLISLAVSSGLFFYKEYLTRQIDVYASSFEKMKSRVEPASLTELVSIASRIESAKKILARHKTTSPLFEILEKNTLKNNFFTLFSLRKQESKEIGGLFQSRLTLDGVSKSYTDLAKQMNIFKSAPHFKEVKFSKFRLLETGDVAYSVDLVVEQSLF